MSILRYLNIVTYFNRILAFHPLLGCMKKELVGRDPAQYKMATNRIVVTIGIVL